MTKNENRKIMPTPSQYLVGKNVKLRFIQLVPGNKEKGYVPYYHFVIENDTNDNIGHINLRIGDTNHINYCAGHIGYEVLPAFRGNYISYYSCLALEPFVKLFYDSVLITVNPLNIPSIRIIEKLRVDS